MSQQVQEAYIVAATRTPADTRPDDLLVHV